MTPIQPSDFPEFFLALHDDGSKPGFGPFPWQRRLAERVASSDWPEVLDLPTASGKTACIDIAVFALACQATLPSAERTAPRRILFVVDRRILVDAAFRRARRIAERLRAGRDLQGRPSPILARVADALRLLGGLAPDEDPLACSQLRGGVYRDQAWARTPAQPTVITSTVDQVGSRLLFRGYGISDSLKPVHAALAGNDALILLDEAHCARPFLQTARAVRDYRRLATPGRLELPPFHVAVLSATPPDDPDGASDAADPFGLDREDYLPEHLGPRLTASKPALLVEPVNAPFKPGAARDKFAEALVRHARGLAGSDRPRAVVIFINRVETARAVHKLLAADQGADAVLMIGRMRPIDRDDLMEQETVREIFAGAGRDLKRSLFVVATQCLEVGADLDFDALVTECASLDALRQRFGRLNRLGRAIKARAAILARADQVKEDAKPDPIYGEALSRTWSWLREQGVKEDGEGIVDFATDALAARLPDDPARLATLCAPALDAPILLPAHLDCLAQTAPRPDPDPDPPLFLHGPERRRPEVQVCWRADLDTELQGEAREVWAETVSLCPPVAAECMTVPLHLARAWLAGQDHPADDGDVEHATVPESGPSAPTGSEVRSALLWLGPNDERTAVISGEVELQPGDTLVIPAAFAGGDILGHIPNTPACYDVAERAYRAAGRRAMLRLDPRLMRGWPPGKARDLLMGLVSDREVAAGKLTEIRAALDTLTKELQGNTAFDWLREIASDLVDDGKVKLLAYPDHLSNAPEDFDPETEGPAAPYPGGLVLQGSKILRARDREVTASDGMTTEDDTASGADRPVPLDDHSRGVAQEVKRYAEVFGLPEPLRSALVVSALWHDLGKCDVRFQAWLHDGNERVARLAPRLLAKSGGLRRDRRQRARDRERGGWPERGRHEFLSVRIAETLLDRLAPDIDRELVLHLIESHHGHARPFAPFVEGLEPGLLPMAGEHHRQVAALALEPCGGGATFAPPRVDPAPPGLHRLDGGPAERFWELTRRYGWWGLAWLEALLRLADHRVSEREQAQEEVG